MYCTGILDRDAGRLASGFGLSWSALGKTPLHSALKVSLRVARKEIQKYVYLYNNSSFFVEHYIGSSGDHAIIT